ncbi:uncharacterized protein LOC127850425 isoform X3 [Dreissena polymorpha]|nr:uncharacterized protein LOC127850425 isoform X3 [Dreissena polymorpha]
MELLQKDLKMVTGATMNIAMSSVGLGMQDLLARPRFEEDLDQFCADQNAQVVVIMTMTTDEHSQPHREISVYSKDRIYRDQISDVLDNSGEVDLELELLQSPFADLTLYRQGNVKASRKQVLPILKSFLHGDVTPDVSSKEFVRQTSVAKATEGFSHFDPVTSSVPEESPEVNNEVVFDLSFSTGSESEMKMRSVDFGSPDDSLKNLSNSAIEFDPFSSLNDVAGDRLVQNIGQDKSKGQVTSGKPASSLFLSSANSINLLDFVISDSELVDPFSSVDSTNMSANDPKRELSVDKVDMKEKEPGNVERSENEMVPTVDQLMNTDSKTDNNTTADIDFSPTSNTHAQNNFDSAIWASNSTINENSFIPDRSQDFNVFESEIVKIDSASLFNHGESSFLFDNVSIDDQSEAKADIKSRSVDLLGLGTMSVHKPAEKSASLIVECDPQSQADNLAELDEADFFEKVSTPDQHNSGENSPFVNSGISTPYEFSSLYHSRTESESGLAPPNSLMDRGIDEGGQDFHLPSFNSAEMVERIHKKKASIGNTFDLLVPDPSELEEGLLSASTPYTPQNSFREDADPYLLRDVELPSLNNSDMVEKVQQKRNSMVAGLDDTNDVGGILFGYTPTNQSAQLDSSENPFGNFANQVPWESTEVPSDQSSKNPFFSLNNDKDMDHTDSLEHVPFTPMNTFVDVSGAEFMKQRNSLSDPDLMVKLNSLKRNSEGAITQLGTNPFEDFGAGIDAGEGNQPSQTGSQDVWDIFGGGYNENVTQSENEDNLNPFMNFSDNPITFPAADVNNIFGVNESEPIENLSRENLAHYGSKETLTISELHDKANIEAANVVAQNVAIEIIQDAMETFPNLTHPVIAQQVTTEVMEISGLVGIAADSGQDVIGSNEPPKPVPTESPRLRTDYSIETDYLPSMDPLHGSLNMIASSANSRSVETDAEKEVVESESFRKVSCTEINAQEIKTISDLPELKAAIKDTIQELIFENNMQEAMDTFEEPYKSEENTLWNEGISGTKDDVRNKEKEIPHDDEYQAYTFDAGLVQTSDDENELIDSQIDHVEHIILPEKSSEISTTEILIHQATDSFEEEIPEMNDMAIQTDKIVGSVPASVKNTQAHTEGSSVFDPMNTSAITEERYSNDTADETYNYNKIFNAGDDEHDSDVDVENDATTGMYMGRTTNLTVDTAYASAAVSKLTGKSPIEVSPDYVDTIVGYYAGTVESVDDAVHKNEVNVGENVKTITEEFADLDCFECVSNDTDGLNIDSDMADPVSANKQLIEEVPYSLDKHDDMFGKFEHQLIDTNETFENMSLSDSSPENILDLAAKEDAIILDDNRQVEYGQNVRSMSPNAKKHVLEQATFSLEELGDMFDNYEKQLELRHELYKVVSSSDSSPEENTAYAQKTLCLSTEFDRENTASTDREDLENATREKQDFSYLLEEDFENQFERGATAASLPGMHTMSTWKQENHLFVELDDEDIKQDSESMIEEEDLDSFHHVMDTFPDDSVEPYYESENVDGQNQAGKIDENVWDDLKDEPENSNSQEHVHRNNGDMVEHESKDDGHQDIKGKIGEFNADYIESESLDNLNHANRIDDTRDFGAYECEHANHQDQDGGIKDESESVESQDHVYKIDEDDGDFAKYEFKHPDHVHDDMNKKDDVDFKDDSERFGNQEHVERYDDDTVEDDDDYATDEAYTNQDKYESESVDSQELRGRIDKDDGDFGKPDYAYHQDYDGNICEDYDGHVKDHSESVYPSYHDDRFDADHEDLSKYESEDGQDHAHDIDDDDDDDQIKDGSESIDSQDHANRIHEDDGDFAKHEFKHDHGGRIDEEDDDHVKYQCASKESIDEGDGDQVDYGPGSVCVQDYEGRMQDDGESENVEIVVKSYINDNDGGDCVQNEYEQADYQNHAERIEDEVVDSSREKDNRKQDGNMYEFGGEAGHQIQLEYDANENIELNDSSTTSFDDGVNDIMFNFKSDHKIKLKDFKRGGSETTSTAEHNSISPDSSNSFPSSPTDSDNSELVTVMENEIKYKHDQENYSQDRAWLVQSDVVQDDENRRETHNLDLYQNKCEEDVYSDHDSHLAGSGHILASDIGITSGLDDFFGLNEPEFKDKTSDNENAGVINDDKFYISFTDSTTEDVPSNSVNDYDPFNLLTDNHEMNENVNAFEPLIGNNNQNEINDNDPFEKLTKCDEIKDNVTDAFSTEDKIDSLNSSDKYNFFSNDEKDHVYNGASFPEQENLLTISSMPVESVSSIETPVEETVSGFYEINPEINTGEHVKEFISNSVCVTNLGDMETGFYVVNSEENDLKETVNFSIEKFAIDKANEIIKDIIPKDEMECSVSSQESSEAGVYEFQEPERENSDIMDDCVDVRITQTQGMDHTSYSDNSYQEGSGYLDNDAQSALLETKDPSIDTDQTQMDTGNSYSLLESLNCEQDVGQSIDSIGEPRDIINIAKELRVDQARASINNGETVHANEHQDDVISEYNVVVHENIDIVNAEEVNLHDDNNDLTTDINQDNKASIKGNNDTMETLNNETEVNTKINNDDIQHTESYMHDSSENDDSQGFNEVENVCPAAEEDDHIDETGFDPSELKNKRFMMKTGPGMPQISIDLASSVESSLSNDSDREAFIEVEAELTSDFTEDETEIHQTCNERDDDDADDKENIRPNMNNAESWMKVDTVTPAIDIKFDSENKSGSQRELILNDFDAEIQGTVLQNISIGSAFSPLESPCENAFEIGYQINPLFPEYNNNYEVDDVGDSTDEESGDLKKKPFVRFSNDIITDDHEIEKLEELADSLVSVAVQDALFELENSTSEKDGPGDEINTKILIIADNLVKEVITEAIEIVGNQEPNTFVEFEIADAMKETGLEEDDSSDSDDGSSTTTEGSYQIDVSDDLTLDSSPEKELEVEETHPSSEADPQLSLSISSPDDDVSVDNSCSIIDQSDPAIAPSFKKIPVDGSYRSFSFPDYEDHTLTSNPLDSNTGIVFEFAKGENDVNSRTFRQSSGLTLVKQDTIVPDIVISTEMSPEYDVEDITDYGADMSMTENTESKDELSDDETDKNINYVTTYVSFVEGEIASMNTTANLESHLGDEALDKGLPVNEIQDENEEDNLVDFKLEDVTRRTLDLTTNETDAYLILSMSAVSNKEANDGDSVVANTVTVDLSSQVIRKQSIQNNDDTSGESDNIEVLVASSAQRQEVPADNFDTFDDGIQLTGMGEDDLRENTGAHIKDMIEKENFNEVSNQVDLGAGFVDHKSNNKIGEFDVYDAATFSNLSEKPIEISEYSENVVEKHIDHFVERLNFVEKTEHVQSFDDEVSEIVEQTKQFSDVVEKADDNMAVTGDVWSFVEKPFSNVELFDLSFAENCTDNDLAIEKVIDMPIEQKTVAKDESEEIIDDLQINNGETHISEAHDQMSDVEILNEVIEPQGDDIRVEEIGIENRSTQEQIKQDLLLNTETYNQLVDGFNESELDKLHDYVDKTYFTGTESETTQSHVIQDLSEGAEIHNQLVNNVNEDKSHLSGDDVNNEDITRRENAYDEDSTIVEPTKEFNDVEKADDNVAETNNVWSFVEKPILNVEQFDISFAENCADNDDLAIEKVIDMPVEHKTVSKDESVNIIDDLQINYGGTHISEAHDQMSDVEILNEVIWPHGDDIRVEEIGIENGSTQEQIEQDLLQNTETYDQLVDGFNENELDKLQDYEFLTDLTGTKSETTQSHVLQDLSEYAEIQNQLVINVNENKSHTSHDDVNNVDITRRENAYDEDSTIVEPTKQFSDVVEKADDNFAETNNVWSFVEKPFLHVEQFDVSFAENCADNYLAMENVIDMPVQHKTVAKDESVKIIDDLQIKDGETHFSEAHDQSSDDWMFNEDIEPHSDVIRNEEIGIKNGSTQKQIEQDLLQNTETYNQLVDGFNETELVKLQDYDDKTYFTETDSETTQSHVFKELSDDTEIHNQLVDNVNESISHTSQDDDNNLDISRSENTKTQSQYVNDSLLDDETKKKMPLFKDESDEIEALMEVQPANTYTKEIEETTKEVYKPLIKDNSEDSGFSLGTRPKHRSSEYVTRKEIFYTTSGRMSVSIDSILDPPTDQELDIAANSQVTIEEEPSMPIDGDEDLPTADQTQADVVEKPLVPQKTGEVTTQPANNDKVVVKEKAMDETQEWHEDPIPGMGHQAAMESESDSESESDNEYGRPARPDSLPNGARKKKKISPVRMFSPDSTDALIEGIDDLPTPDDLDTPDDLEGEGLEWEDETPIDPTDTKKKFVEYMSHDDEQEKYENTTFRKVEIAGKDFRVDMKVIEPYKKVLSHGGYYGDGLNAIILFCGCYLPDRSRSDYQYVMDNLFLYVISTLELLVAEDYLIVYFHGATPRGQMPSFGWLKRCYQMIDRRLRKNLKALLMVHPTLWLKTVVLMTKPFISSKFSSKLRFVKTLQELGKVVPMEYIYVPDPVQHTERMLQIDPDYLEKWEKEQIGKSKEKLDKGQEKMGEKMKKEPEEKTGEKLKKDIEKKSEIPVKKKLFSFFKRKK